MFNIIPYFEQKSIFFHRNFRQKKESLYNFLSKYLNLVLNKTLLHFLGL